MSRYLRATVPAPVRWLVLAAVPTLLWLWLEAWTATLWAVSAFNVLTGAILKVIQ